MTGMSAHESNAPTRSTFVEIKREDHPNGTIVFGRTEMNNSSNYGGADYGWTPMTRTSGRLVSRTAALAALAR